MRKLLLLILLFILSSCECKDHKEGEIFEETTTVCLESHISTKLTPFFMGGRMKMLPTAQEVCDKEDEVVNRYIHEHGEHRKLD